MIPATQEQALQSETPAQMDGPLVVSMGDLAGQGTSATVQMTDQNDDAGWPEETCGAGQGDDRQEAEDVYGAAWNDDTRDTEDIYGEDQNGDKQDIGEVYAVDATDHDDCFEDGFQMADSSETAGQEGDLQIPDTSENAGQESVIQAVVISDTAARDEVLQSTGAHELASQADAPRANALSATKVCGMIWAVGAILCFFYGITIYARLVRKLEEAIPAGTWKKYPVKSSDVSGVPMSFGILHPGIYVPAYFREDGTKGIESGEKEMILQHEATHLRRRDPLWKLISLMALCLHWWNPIVWLGIRLFNRDMEMACDEGVLSQIGQEKRKDYANVLFHFAQRQSGLSLSAAFGESNAESRIKEALKYKKRSTGASVMMICLVVLLGGCLVTKPGSSKEETMVESTEETSAGEIGDEKEPGVITEITNLEQAIQVYLPFQTAKGQRTAPVNVPYFGMDENRYMQLYVDELAEDWKVNSPEKYQALLDPATALETLIPLKGGTGEALQESFTSAMVQYTFANGEKGHYYMALRGEIWYPYLLVEQLIRDKTVENGRGITKRWDQLMERKEFLSKTTAAQLRDVTLDVSDVEYGRYQRQISADDPNDLVCWDPKELGNYCILQEIPEEDVCLYGLYDGFAMMLRVGDEAYPIYGYWTNLRSDVPRIYCGDYDQDGQREFALITLGKTGTGTAGNWLHVMEITKNGLEIHEPKAQGMYGQLEQNVTYRYDEKSLMLRVETAEGDVAFTSLEGISALASGSEKLVALCYGHVESFSVVDDYLFYDVCSGIQISNKGDPEFDGIDLSCQLKYHEDGSFGIGNIELERAWTGPIEQIDISEGYAGEEVICRGQVWLNRNGTPDWIVTSVTYHDENRGEFWKKRMDQGEICIVRVYDGVRQESAWADGRVLEGYFDKESVIWEKTLADAHAGNGLIYLCEKNGKNYLLTADYSMWQGIMEPEYKVLAFDEDGREYTVDSARTVADVNSLEGAFSVDELVEFTEKMDEWLQNGTLIALTDIDHGRRIRKGVLGELVPLGYQAEAFEAWEIWQTLADTINQFIYDGQISSIAPLTVPYEYIPCSGMENLRESLTSLRKRFEVFFEWQMRVSLVGRYSEDLQDGRNVITSDITHDGYQDTIIVDYSNIMKDDQALLTIDARDQAGQFLWEDILGLPHQGWGKYYLSICQGLPYLVKYYPLEETQGSMYGYFKVFWINNKGEEQILEERTVDRLLTEDYAQEAEEFDQAIKSYLSKACFLASTWQGELSVTKKPSNW